MKRRAKTQHPKSFELSTSNSIAKSIRVKYAPQFRLDKKKTIESSTLPSQCELVTFVHVCTGNDSCHFIDSVMIAQFWFDENFNKSPLR